MLLVSDDILFVSEVQYIFNNDSFRQFVGNTNQRDDN